MNLRLRIIAGLVFFALLATVATLYVFRQAMPALEQPAYTKAIESARALDEKINHILSTYYNATQQFAATPTTADPENWANVVPANSLIAAMNADVKKDDAYRVSLYLDLAGNVRAVNTQSPKGKPVATEGFYGVNFANAEWFMHARDGKFLESKSGANSIAISGPVRDAQTAKAYGDDGFVLVFSTQVKDATGKPVGIWADFVDFSAIETILAQQFAAYQSQGLPHTQITLLDASGTLLADVFSADTHPRNFEMIGKENLVTEQYTPAINGMNGKSGSLLAPLKDKSGVETTTQLVGFYHSEEVFTYPGIGWTVLVRFDKNEIFASLNDVKRQIVQGISAVMGVMFILSLLVSGSITKRMRRGKESTEQTRRDAHRERFDNELKPAVSGLSEATKTLYHDIAELHRTIESHRTRSGKLANAAEATTKQLSNASDAARTFDRASDTLTTLSEKAAKTTAAAREQLQDIAGKTNYATNAADQFHTNAQDIGTIAKQIHLLALNAMIEVSRVGEPGKGLSHMVDELKTLAGKTASLSETLNSQAQTVQTNTRYLAEKMQTLREQIASAEQSSRDLNDTVGRQQEASTAIARELAGLSEAHRPLGEDTSLLEKGAIATHDSTQAALDKAERLEGEMKALVERLARFHDAADAEEDA